MLDDFFVRAVLAGIGVALACGPLGCFVVWRRMAYFGDATSHAALLGVAFAIAVDAPVVAGVTVTALAMALLVAMATGRTYAMDTMLGVASHGALAVGLVAVSFLSGIRVDLVSYLFGDILAVSKADIAFIFAGAAAIALLLVWRWRGLLLSTLNEDLALSAGIRPAREKMVLTLALALMVAVSIKVVGVLLITAMLIIPAAAARVMAGSPGRMAFLAAGVGVVAVISGLQGSLLWDIPAGPAIVSAGIGILIVANGASALRKVADRR